MYDGLLQKIAEQGVIVVGLMHFETSFNYSNKAFNLNKTLDWLEHNLRK